MSYATSGVPTFDQLLGGGLILGDNVVWVGDTPAAPWSFCERFLGATGEPRSLVTLDGAAFAVDADVEVVDASALVRHRRRDELEALILGRAREEGARIVVTGLDDVMVRWGAAATVELYRRICPRLFERGTIAYWTGSRAVLTVSVIESITKIAQCVFEVRPGRLRVTKAEGRPNPLQGRVVEIVERDGEPVVAREHTVGRVGEGLRRIRAERKLTQGQIAELAGVTPAAVSQAETGRRSLSLDTIVPLCDKLGIGVDELLGTTRTSDPVVARHDRQGPARDVVPLFDDPGRGVRAYLVRLGPREHRTPPFAHKGLELILVAQGLVLIDLDETTPVVRRGDAVMVTREPVRGWTNLGPDDAELYWIPVG